MKSKVVAILEARTGKHLAEMTVRQGGIPMLAPAAVGELKARGVPKLGPLLTVLAAALPSIQAGSESV